jgi:hypothetical protein
VRQLGRDALVDRGLVVGAFGGSNRFALDAMMAYGGRLINAPLSSSAHDAMLRHSTDHERAGGSAAADYERWFLMRRVMQRRSYPFLERDCGPGSGSHIGHKKLRGVLSTRNSLR